MARKKKKRSQKLQISPEAKARANARLRARWAKKGAKKGQSRTPEERIQMLFDEKTVLPSDEERKKNERAEAARARRAASSTSPGKGRPRLHGKPRGTGGRLTKGS